MTDRSPRRSPGRSPRTVAIAVAAGALVVAAAVLLPSVLGGGGDGPAGEQARVESTGSVDTSNLALVRDYEVPPWSHVDDDADVDYPQTPPVGGDHWNIWLECGVYGGPVPDEYAVHDLEHGAIWITYRPDEVDADGIDHLASVLPPNGIMSPYPTQDAPVVLTVWGRQLDLLGPDDPRIPLFLDAYGGGATAPDPFSSCNGGITGPPG